MANPLLGLLPLIGVRLSRNLRANGVDLARENVSYDLALLRGRGALNEGHANAAYAGRVLAGDRSPLGELDRTYGALVADSQAEYLENFYNDIRAGRYTDDAGELNEDAIAQRAGFYEERLRGTANEAWCNTLGDELVYWRLGGDEGASCTVCPDLAASGPYKANDLPTQPGNNETPCLFNCRCYLETESGEPAFKAFEIVRAEFAPHSKTHAVCGCGGEHAAHNKAAQLFPSFL